MNKNTKVILKKKLETTELSGEKVMIDFETGKYFWVKGVGNDIWDMIQSEIEVGAVIDGLMQEYDVSVEECEKAVIDFLENLQRLGFIN